MKLKSITVYFKIIEVNDYEMRSGITFDDNLNELILQILDALYDDIKTQITYLSANKNTSKRFLRFLDKIKELITIKSITGVEGLELLNSNEHFGFEVVYDCPLNTPLA